MRRTIICTLLAASLFPSAALAAAGEVSFLEGSATRTPEKGKPAPLAVKGTVEQGDVIETGAAGKLEITLSDKSVVRLGPSSKLTLDEAAFTDTSRSFKGTLLLGRVWSKVKEKLGSSERTFEIRTERAVAGVRGTIFRVETERKAMLVRVYEGTVAVAGNQELAAPPPKKGERVQVPGPTEVTKKDWERMVGQMMQLKVSAAGVPDPEPTRFAEADEVKDEWAQWNKKRDAGAP
jgi:hypothetical protein